MLRTLEKYSTLLALIIANLVPLYGIWYLGWDFRVLLIIYWVEALVVGCFNILKMLLASDDAVATGFWKSIYWGLVGLANRLVIILGFVLLWAAYLLLLGYLLSLISGMDLKQDFLDDLSEAINMYLFPIALFVLSHAYSFIIKYLGRAEYKQVKLRIQFSAPWSRLIIVHIVILAGSLLIMYLSDSIIPVILMIIAKIYADGDAHLREHSH